MVRPNSIGSPGFLAKIGIVTLVPVLVMAFFLVRGLEGSARASALDRAQHEVDTTARLLGVQKLRAGLEGTLSGSDRRELVRGLALPGFGRRGLGRRPDRSPGSSGAGRRPEPGGHQRQLSVACCRPQGRAGTGEVGEKAVEVYRPLLGAGGRPLGALRVRCPSEPLDATVADQTRPLYLILGLGLAALCLGLGLVLRETRCEMLEEATRKERQALSDGAHGPAQPHALQRPA